MSAVISPVSGKGSSGHHHVSLQVPDHFCYQLIYRTQRREPFAVAPKPGVSFTFCHGPREYLAVKPLRRVVGGKEWLKGLVRMFKGRKFYCVQQNDAILHTGWVTVSYCRHYKVEAGDVVIGPIWSSPEARGQGIATFATMKAMNEMVAGGASVFFIDTTNTNSPCRRMIEKCGYEAPLASYIR